MITNTAAASVSAYVKQIREVGLKGVFVVGRSDLDWGMVQAHRQDLRWDR